MYKRISLLSFSFLAACSSTPENPDPHKEFNKDMLELNLTLDEEILKPVSMTYKEATPKVMRESVSNFLTNWKEPFYCLNYLVSFDAEHASNSLFRFVINSTLGILGFFDIGEQIGLEKAKTSYKSTLKRLDVPTGDYIVLPVFGFSSTRDTIAEPVSWFADPMGYVIGFPYMLLKAVVSEISYRAENSEFIDSIKKDSLDLYSTTRSMYFQKYGSKSEKQSFEDSPSPDNE